MPEIKNTFSQGKMNKDLDERIISTGEYRDAMNVQVSTSEEAGVGSLQNILGNERVENIIGGGWICIGAVSDDKENSLYWFVRNQNAGRDVILRYKVDTQTAEPVIVDTNQDVLKFTDNIITGINVLDNMLMWTDNNSEPKKINIDRCIQGTSAFNVHTKLVVDNTVTNTDIKEEHITVIKKRPIIPPKVEVARPLGQASLEVTCEFSISNLGLELINVGDTGFIRTPRLQQGNIFIPQVYSVGTTILLSRLTTSGSLPTNSEVRCKVTNVTTTIGNPGYSTMEVEILSILSSLPPTIATFTGNNISTGLIMNAVEEKDLEKNLFETKFIRFATRWKYEDGEYSAFSPFSDIAFKAYRFSFHPTRDTYNLGMENNCDNIKLTQLVSPDMPEDVVQIDILFKQEDSTTIYSLQSIKPNDPIPPGQSHNHWNKNQNPPQSILDPDFTLNSLHTSNTDYQGEYTVSTENIYAALPANQLLRPWDNVPKKALAQEITGNRLVYGNYTQGYNMVDGNDIAKPYLELNYRQRSFNNDDVLDFEYGLKSLKTFKNYQLGVVYGDEYGRETPVFTSSNAALTIPWDSDNSTLFKGNASRSIHLTAVLRGNQPDFAKYYKFFIKENSGGYYNISMDRVYRAEDNENLWISFPSSEVNKIKKDEYIILKKKYDLEEQVEINNKYKVIDIKNEVPEFIKYKYVSIGNVGGSNALVSTLFVGYNTGLNIPQQDENQIIIDADVWKNNGGADLPSISETLELQFTKTSSISTIESERYRIVGIEELSQGAEYKITLDKFIKTSDSWATTTPTSGVVEDTVRLKILQLIPKSSAEFEGRFFVKIIYDSVARTYLEPYIDESLRYRIASSVNTFYFADTQAASGADASDGIVNSNIGIQYNSSSNTTSITTENKSDTEDSWNLLYKYGGADVTPGWFIDHAYYASVQPTDPSDVSGQTGLLEVDISGRMRRGHGGTPNGQYFVDSNEGIIDVDGVGPYQSPPSGDNTTVNGWGGRSWTNKAFSTTEFHSVPFGSGTNDNSMDNIYENIDGTSGGRYYMHLSFGPVGEQLWYPDTSQSDNLGNNWNGTQDYDWQQINPGAFVDWDDPSSAGGTFVPNSVYYDQWKIQDQNHLDTANKLVTGSKFKITGNEEVFTIKRVSVKRLYNHTPFRESQNEWDGTQQVNLNNSVEYHFNTWWNNGNPGLGSASPTSTGGINRRALADALERFGKPNNRRLLYIIELDKNPNDYGISFTWDVDSSHSIRFLEPIATTNEFLTANSPAIWETEQKEETDLNIYYEASQAIPISLDTTKGTSEIIAPIGSRIWCSKSGSMPVFAGVAENLDFIIKDWELGSSGRYDILNLASPGLNVLGTSDLSTQTSVYTGKALRLFRHDNSFITVKIQDVIEIIGSFVTKVSIKQNTKGGLIGLSYYDCFSFGNGVESNRIRDDFNTMAITKGVKASSIIEEQYKEENRKNGLIYSGIYNSTSGVNNLNQFIQAEKITKDLNPTYGSIQKLFQRRIDLVSLCEDKIVKVLSYKDTLYNADGNAQLVATNKVLGEANPFVGDYGISKNPESFCKESYRAYFTDKQRGTVLRLSMDGLTPISQAGMSDYFKDNLRRADIILGSYDNNKKNYNLTLSTPGQTIIERGEGSLQQPVEAVTLSYDERVKGWVSFKSFIPEFGISVSNNYYTFQGGRLWEHHSENVDRNIFYDDNVNALPSSVTSVLNGQPDMIKSYNTLNYEGNAGWVCNLIRTDQQAGTIPEFINKEGKFFNYIRGEGDDIDLQSFNFQGIGQSTDIDYNI